MESQGSIALGKKINLIKYRLIHSGAVTVTYAVEQSQLAFCSLPIKSSTTRCIKTENCVQSLQHQNVRVSYTNGIKLINNELHRYEAVQITEQTTLFTKLSRSSANLEQQSMVLLIQNLLTTNMVAT